MSRLLALAALLLASCANAPVTVAGFYEGHTLDELRHQALPDLEDTEMTRAGVRVGAAHPHGYHRTSFQVFYEELDVNTPEGPARLTGGGAGFSYGARRIEGIHEPDSRWLLPYRFSAAAVTTTGSSRPAPDIEYERMNYGEARLDLGVGVEYAPVIVHAGFTTLFIDGRLDARRFGPMAGPRRQTVNGANFGPYVALELIYAEERPIRVELRATGGDIEEFVFSAGVGF